MDVAIPFEHYVIGQKIEVTWVAAGLRKITLEVRQWTQKRDGDVIGILALRLREWLASEPGVYLGGRSPNIPADIGDVNRDIFDVDTTDDIQYSLPDVYPSTPVNNGDLPQTAKIGIGVGVGLGSLLLITLSVLLTRFVLKRRGRDSKADFASGPNEEIVHDVGKPPLYSSPFIVHSVNGHNNAAELATQPTSVEAGN
ncbi:hypothetical protein QC761_0065250 [Podospora bellae-mahoneyi]|uniref:Mid2 domain-containing protein n=1 Tax=Podospora bellae-mahoneyi TaxID=2093777 RepID=A0ABR0FGV8_9PEZI|nr:hypothetical protein QC761_0065250 [Podospora bellae-mahoneyi]